MAKRRAPHKPTQAPKPAPTEAPKPRGREGTTVSRVGHIAHLMRTLQFKRGTTVRELAERWELSEDYVRELTAEASKIVRAEVMDPDAVQMDVSAALVRVMKQAWRLGDFKVVVSAAKTWAQVTGAMAPKRITMKQEATEKLTDTELEELVAEAVAIIEARKKAAA